MSRRNHEPVPYGGLYILGMAAVAAIVVLAVVRGASEEEADFLFRTWTIAVAASVVIVIDALRRHRRTRGD